MTRLALHSAAFQPNSGIPRKYTGDGDDISPALSWSGAPDGTREFALIVDDPDAPTAEPWVHWLLYKIPASTSSLPERVPPALHLAQPAGALHGVTSWPKRIGYGGPAPPHGHGVHHYHFKLIALDAPLALAAGADKQALLAATKGHVLATAELVGTYER